MPHFLSVFALIFFALWLTLAELTRAQSMFQADLQGLPQYEIAFKKKVLVVTGDDIPDPGFPVASKLKLKSHTGQDYICVLPAANYTQSQPAEKEDSEKLVQKGLSLLRSIGGEAGCLYYNTGYWTYEYCHKYWVRQFHIGVGQGDLTLDYYLGKSVKTRDSQEPDEPVKIVKGVDPFRGERRFLVQTWGGGSECDSDENPENSRYLDEPQKGLFKQRRIEIEFRCSPSLEEKISWVREVKTCEYQMSIQTFRLCDEPAFSGKAYVQPLQIQCHTVVSSEEERTKLVKQSGGSGYHLNSADPRDDPTKVSNILNLVKAGMYDWNSVTVGMIRERRRLSFEPKINALATTLSDVDDLPITSESPEYDDSPVHDEPKLAEEQKENEQEEDEEIKLYKKFADSVAKLINKFGNKKPSTNPKDVDAEESKQETPAGEVKVYVLDDEGRIVEKTVDQVKALRKELRSNKEGAESYTKLNEENSRRIKKLLKALVGDDDTEEDIEGGTKKEKHDEL